MIKVRTLFFYFWVKKNTMKNSGYFFPLIFLFSFILISSCVSKKKHLATIQSLRTTNENVVNDWQEKFNVKRRELDQANDSIKQLELNLAERKGENNILVSLRNELQTQIESMESQMNNLGTSSKSVEQNLKIEIQKRENEINQLKIKLTSINSVLDNNKELFDRVSRDLAFEMQSLEKDEVIVTTQLDEVILVIPEKELFKKNSSSRLTDNGIILLEKIAQTLNQYPQFLFKIIGHTDNTPANVKKYKDNWNFSALQSASVVRSLVEDFDMNPSQLTVAGKGEFDPRTSNATIQGKMENRRIEIIIYRKMEDITKKIKAITVDP